MADYGRIEEWDDVFSYLKKLNPNITDRRAEKASRDYLKRDNRLQKVVVANRGEIAKRFFLALHEEGIPTVAVVTDPDIGQSWYDFANEVIQIGDPSNYINIPVIIGAAILSGSNAIFPGYGFLSENIEFAEMLQSASKMFSHELIFMGPKPEVMRYLSDKVSARNLARDNNVSLFEGADNIPDFAAAKKSAGAIGYPVIVKLSSGGGGRGIIPVFSEEELVPAIEQCQRIGRAHYHNNEYYIEKYIVKPVHLEIQIFNGWAIGIRKCAVQRRNQKIIEESGHTFLNDTLQLSLLAEAQKMANYSGYRDGCGAGTVEFLLDYDTGKFGFLEVNTRLQVEYAVTEQTLGMDLVKWQILLFDGREDEISYLDVIKARMTITEHAIECRIYAEEPVNNYQPSPGIIQELILPTFHGIRCDFGFSEQDRILPMYDAMIGKIIAVGAGRKEAMIRLERALQEMYIKGINTNIKQLLKIVRHEEFQKGDYTNKLLTDYPELELKGEEIDGRILSDRRGRGAILFGVLTEYIRIYNSMSNDLIVLGNPGISIRNRKITAIPFRYRVKYLDNFFTMEVFQVGLDKFYLFVDGMYNGKVKLISCNERNDDYLFTYGTRSYRLRVDRQRLNHLSFRMQDESNKTNYFRMQIRPEGYDDKIDPEGLVRSPFQCTFITFPGARDKKGGQVTVGTRVKKDDPLVIISSMKMETVIKAPIDGEVEYLIENGESSKLILGETADGKIIGKSIEEREVLARIKPDADSSALKSDEAEQGSGKKLMSFKTQGLVSIEDIEGAYLKDPERFIHVILELLQSCFEGFFQQDVKIREIENILNKIPDASWEKIITENNERKLNTIIGHYCNIKQLFSPVISGKSSFYDEFSYFIRNMGNINYQPSPAFKELFSSILKTYGLLEWKPSIARDSLRMKQIVLHVERSYHICFEHKPIIRKLAQVLSNSRNNLEETYNTLADLYLQEQTELDDSLGRFILKVLHEKYHQSPELIEKNVKLAEIIGDRDLVKYEKEAQEEFLSSPEYNTQANQRMIQMGKWPIEIWVKECFDQGACEEIFIDMIDRRGMKGPAAVGGTDAPKVAARIYLGGIQGRKALFFMKDSRINGGATGDLEGLKYVASVYIAYVMSIPLYVWNDGAGANIKEGMISLNRAAQGFMMNTISSYAGPEDFFRYVENTGDPGLAELISEINVRFFPGSDTQAINRRNHFTVAVGTGSSAGLDVYGSSQAAIQIMLDHENSYRVLTGSNVIRTVMGEDISNYDIGGARVMSKWTGIVDSVAKNKKELIDLIRQMHAVFAYETDLPAIKRPGKRKETAGMMTSWEGLTEDILCPNLDGGEFFPFKSDYYGSGSLTAGFGKIGGRRVLVMGPRSNFGLRSFAAVTRARELLTMARKTSSHQILVIGKKWMSEVNFYDIHGTRARIDYLQVMRDFPGLKFNIITDMESFHAVDVNSLADVVIFVRCEGSGNLELQYPEFIEKNSMFITDSMGGAFDIVHRIISMIDPLDGKIRKFEIPDGAPSIPEDTNSPYDMIESVISKTFDKGSFLEFFGDMNRNKTRSNLITGLASLNGRTVGIIADQPLVLGGGADAIGTEKFRIFTEFLNKKGIPLVMLSNSSGFIPGTKQERIRIQSVGAYSLDVNVLGRMPVVSVVLSQNYGGRQIHAFGKLLRPGIVYMALERSIMAVIGENVAFNLLEGRRHKALVDKGDDNEAKELRAAFSKKYLEKARAGNDGTKTGAVDILIKDIKDLRKFLNEGFVEAEKRAEKAFGGSGS